MLREIELIQGGKRQICLYRCDVCGFEREARRDNVKRYNYVCSNCKRQGAEERKEREKERTKKLKLRIKEKEEVKKVNIEKAKRKQNFKRFRDTKYLVSDRGRIYDEDKGAYVIPRISSRGDARVYLDKTRVMHRVVAEVHKAKGKGFTVDHIDGRVKNNTIGNLEYCSLEENLKRRDKFKDKTEVTVEDVEQALKDIRELKKEKEGTTTIEASIELGIDINVLRYNCRRFGIKFKTGGTKREKISIKTEEEATEKVKAVMRRVVLEGSRIDYSCSKEHMSDTYFRKLLRHLDLPKVDTRIDHKYNRAIKLLINDYSRKSIAEMVFRNKNMDTKSLDNRIFWLEYLGEL